MNKHNNGSAQIAGIVLALVLAVGGFFFWQSQSNKNDAMTKTKVDNSAETNSMEKKESMKPDNNSKKENSGAMMTKVLAQKNSSFVEFNQKDYENAITEGKIIYLEFYANWCPICRAQEPDLIEGINKLSRADVAGFRVNFKDDQTDQDEKALSDKYKIPYQHHKIVIKDGRVVIDSADTWDAKTLVSELSKL